jgi:glycosyltransferase involved in cell wall biosynthesis
VPDLSVVLPCYNEANGIERILQRFAELNSGVPYELILVDNGSTDGTQEKLKDLLPQYPFARSVTVAVNRGYGYGILMGLQEAAGLYLAWSHADLQTDPADVFRAYETLRSAANPDRTLVKGRRYGRGVGDQIITWGMQLLATLILRTRLHEINAQPKVFHRSLMDECPRPPSDFNFDLYVLYRAARRGWAVLTIPVQLPPRVYGYSHWASTWQSKIRTILRSICYMAQLALEGT